MSSLDKIKINPYSELAGAVAQYIADTDARCASPDCAEPITGCAVHPCDHETDSVFYPVCKRHKTWEFTKVEEPPFSIYL